MVKSTVEPEFLSCVAETFAKKGNTIATYRAQKMNRVRSAEYNTYYLRFLFFVLCGVSEKLSLFLCI